MMFIKKDFGPFYRCAFRCDHCNKQILDLEQGFLSWGAHGGQPVHIHDGESLLERGLKYYIPLSEIHMNVEIGEPCCHEDWLVPDPNDSGTSYELEYRRRRNTVPIAIGKKTASPR